MYNLGTEQEIKDLEERFEAGRWNLIEVTPAVGEKRKPTTPTKEAKKKKRDKESDDGVEGKENDARTSLVAEEKEVGKDTEGKEGDARMKGKAKTKEKKGSTVAKGRRGALKDDGAGKKKAAAKVVKKKKEDGKCNKLLYNIFPFLQVKYLLLAGCLTPLRYIVNGLLIVLQTLYLHSLQKLSQDVPFHSQCLLPSNS